MFFFSLSLFVASSRYAFYREWGSQNEHVIYSGKYLFNLLSCPFFSLFCFWAGYLWTRFALDTKSYPAFRPVCPSAGIKVIIDNAGKGKEWDTGLILRVQMTRISTTPKESSRCLFGFVCVCVYDSIPRPRPLGSEKAPRLQAGHMPILSSGAPLALSSSLRRWYQLVSSCPLDYHGFLEIVCLQDTAVCVCVCPQR